MSGKQDARPARREKSGRRVDAVMMAAAIALCAAVIAGFAWTRPTTTTTPLSYTEGGSVTYSATTSASSMYGTAGLTTGKPVYLKAVKSLQVTYHFSASSSASLSLRGTEQLVATVADGLGATRSFALQPMTRFSGLTFASKERLDLDRVAAAVASLARSAGSNAPSTYTVSLSPSVKASGTLDGHAIKTSFDKAVEFTYASSSASGSAELTPSSSSPGIGGPGSSVPASSLLSVSTTTPTRIPTHRLATLFLGVSVLDARLAALAVLLVAGLILVVAGRRLIADAGSDDEGARIAVRYGSMLVDAKSLPGAPMVRVELVAIEDLVRVAKQFEAPLLHEAGLLDSYAVIDNGVLYTYRTELSSGEQDRSTPTTQSGVGHEDPILTSARRLRRLAAHRPRRSSRRAHREVAKPSA